MVGQTRDELFIEMRREYERRLVENNFGVFCSACGSFCDIRDRQERGECPSCAQRVLDEKKEKEFEAKMPGMMVAGITVEHGLYKTLTLIDGDGKVYILDTPFFDISVRD